MGINIAFMESDFTQIQKILKAVSKNYEIDRKFYGL